MKCYQKGYSHITGIVLSVFFLNLLSAPADAQHQSRKKSPEKSSRPAPCSSSIETCPVIGCHPEHVVRDPRLNEIKNIKTAILDNPRDVTLEWMKKHSDPPSTYKLNGDRTPIARLGEGEVVRAVGWLLAVKPGGAESCNCYLTGVKNTDNHLVLITSKTLQENLFRGAATSQQIKAMFHKRESESVTAEFTPRVRKTHPNFSNAKLSRILDRTEQELYGCA